MHLHSSWNSDRVAACCINKPRKYSSVRKPVRMYTELRGHSLAVKTRRGAVKFAHIYSANIVEASFDDGKLNVELENGATYAYVYANGRFSREVDSTVRPALVGMDIVKAA